MKTAYERVKEARSVERPTGQDFITGLFKGFIELHGDRRFSDDTAMLGGLAKWKGQAVTVLTTEKGKDTKERIYRNFGAPNPEGYRKALRLMKQAEKFGRPVICFVDTSGAYCGIGAEERGQGQAIAENLMEMMTLRTPILTILIGEGGSGGALALGVADEVWILENAVYSVISPEGCASILWKDAAKADEAAKSLHLTAEDVKELHVAEKVIPEYDGNFNAILEELRGQIEQWMNKVTSCTIEELLEKRYARFRAIGSEYVKEIVSSQEDDR